MVLCGVCALAVVITYLDPPTTITAPAASSPCEPIAGSLANGSPAQDATSRPLAVV